MKLKNIKRSCGYLLIFTTLLLIGFGIILHVGLINTDSRFRPYLLVYIWIIIFAICLHLINWAFIYHLCHKFHIKKLLTVLFLLIPGLFSCFFTNDNKNKTNFNKRFYWRWILSWFIYPAIVASFSISILGIVFFASGYDIHSSDYISSYSGIEASTSAFHFVIVNNVLFLISFSTAVVVLFFKNVTLSVSIFYHKKYYIFNILAPYLITPIMYYDSLNYK